MNEKENKLLINLLNMAADEFSNHCCNDIPREWFEDWSQDELTELDKKICEFNNSPDEYVPVKTDTNWWYQLSQHLDCWCAVHSRIKFISPI